VHELCPTESAHRVLAQLTDAQRDELDEICDYMTTALPALQAAGFVYDCVLHGKTFTRYWDNKFPYLIYVEPESLATPVGGRFMIVIALMLYSAPATAPNA
jgi:hypothetical protein